ncbi:MAG TPA: dihydropteroate synthase [candidate division Zixibacteria bacterium]|nr:dihydropteroate synthase [candidate division Zixibacteria bacterium]
MPKQTYVKQEEIKQVIQLASGKQLSLSRPLVMAVLNFTPDSFSDGGQYNSIKNAVEKVLQMESEGADIIDIGGESSRPGADSVSEKEEISRVIPLISELRKLTNIPISIDTYKSHVAKKAIDAGADIINDISAFRFSPVMAGIVSETNVPIILMHMLGTPQNMQNNPSYISVNDEIISFFTERIDYAVSNGVDKSKLILDPGIGFGKRLSDNLEIIAYLEKYKQFNLPILIGTSRKSFIGMIHPSEKNADSRIGGSIASAVAAVANGANIVRVHDVYETVEALKVLQAVMEYK